MAKDETGGLLSKVVKFVRNPTTNWADLDQAESQRDDGNSKQMLKELVERKKRHDFVRRREFDMLRKLRRRELSGTQSTPPRPSFFQSSLPSKPDERAQTLKKIDEIEAQMSMQWWKTKHRDSVNSSFPPSEPAPGPADTPARPVRPMLEPEPAVAAAAPAATGLTASATAALAAVAANRAQGTAQAAAAGNTKPGGIGKFGVSGSGFSASKYSAIEVGEYAHDPELEEAAIRFANGDDQGAEAGLLDALGSGDGRSDGVETWLTLFDLYRATGQQGRFEVAAMDFANQFQRSAPQWFSMPDLVNDLAEAQPQSVTPQAAHWTCPPLLNLKSVSGLGDVLLRTSPPWRLDWTRLTTIETAALPVLGRYFGEWAARPVEVRLIAGEHLNQLLVDAAPSGDRSVAPEWWHARMALLRVMSRMDDFEMAALSYCVTYEVSPPPWEDPVCTCVLSGAGGHRREEPTTIISALADLSTAQGDLRPVDFRATGMDSVMQPPVSVELSGSIAGDVSATLDTLDKRFLDAEILSISCAKLIRVDFAAAGTLLNWVSSHHAQGREVHFGGVHRLIAGFFNVIGISEMSRITVRTD